jgi:hypothetical protein
MFGRLDDDSPGVVGKYFPGVAGYAKGGPPDGGAPQNAQK